MGGTLEEIVEGEEMKGIKKHMCISDLHIPYLDKRAYKVMKKFAKDYQPDNLYINGDFLDFYSLSKFDKNPKRKDNLIDDINEGNRILRDIRDTFKQAEITYISGNHEQRLQHYLWNKAPELYGIEGLQLYNLLDTNTLNIEYIGTDSDYWKSDNGHKIVSDVLITHGDNRLNGCSMSKYSGYSAKNSMMNLQSSIIMGHTHRLAQVTHTTPYNTMLGLEDGCLCQMTGTANWQQGFVTFETYRGNMVNSRLHFIKDGKLMVDGFMYKERKR